MAATASSGVRAGSATLPRLTHAVIMAVEASTSSTRKYRRSRPTRRIWCSRDSSTRDVADDLGGRRLGQQQAQRGTGRQVAAVEVLDLEADERAQLVDGVVDRAQRLVELGQEVSVSCAV